MKTNYHDRKHKLIDYRTFVFNIVFSVYSRTQYYNLYFIFIQTMLKKYMQLFNCVNLFLKVNSDKDHLIT